MHSFLNLSSHVTPTVDLKNLISEDCNRDMSGLVSVHILLLYNAAGTAITLYNIILVPFLVLGNKTLIIVPHMGEIVPSRPS